ncbi:MAG: hypothetical protein IKT40_01075 [Bacilli bacterium]|nr:hypothetical protein [Bacilli bacterium]
MQEKSYIEFCEKLEHAAHTILEKADTIYKTKPTWSIDELGEFADIIKDVSEMHKNVAKAHYLLTEHSMERF